MSEALDAQRKAKDLFFSLLTEEQKEEFERQGSVTVIGGKTKNPYTILNGWSMNMYGVGPSSSCDCLECKRRNSPRNMCYHMRLECPHWDHMAAQLLYIRYAEDKFLAEAYIS